MRFGWGLLWRAASAWGAVGVVVAWPGAVSAPRGWGARRPVGAVRLGSASRRARRRGGGTRPRRQAVPAPAPPRDHLRRKDAAVVIIGVRRATLAARWELVAACGLLLGQLTILDLVVGLTAAAWSASVGYGVGLWVLLTRALRRSVRAALGPADRVTLVRASLAGGVLALVVTGAAGPALLALAAVALALDAVDGPVARRTGTASALGARFDMEVDAALVLVLSAAAPVAGPWVLTGGLLRYAFVAAGWVAPWLRGTLPESPARKAVAAAQGVALVVVASGVLPAPRPVAAAALAALVWSFGRDVWWLWRTR